MTDALPYADRSEAGRVLASKLPQYENREDVRVLGLARGGIAVAAEVATALHAPLDVLVVRKLSLPSQPEFALGAIAVDGTRVLDKDVIAQRTFIKIRGFVNDDVFAADNMTNSRLALLWHTSP